MQTFLPYADFVQSARCLDWRRLGKQRVEAMQIHNTLVNGSRWENHPAVLMWSGFENALLSYMNECIREWISRGYNNTMKIADVESFELPDWFGLDVFHASHRSNLLRKDFNWYSQFGWPESNGLEYYWPTKMASVRSDK
jgi:hypothetical protein